MEAPTLLRDLHWTPLEGPGILLRGVQLLNLEDGPFFGLEIRAVGRRRCPSVGQYMLLKHSSPIFIYYIDTPDCHV